jgi:hypothetical protein
MVVTNMKKKPKGFQSIIRKNVRLAKTLWRDEFTPSGLQELGRLSRELGLSIGSGEILLLNGKWYVTHAGLLRISERHGCLGIRTSLQVRLSDPVANRWIFKATVFKSQRSLGFIGYGDADPSNVSSLVHGAEMRVAETRAVNRALRKAYGIGLCSVEELGCAPRSNTPAPQPKPTVSTNGNNSHHNGQPRLRDRLSLLIRQYHLNAGLVKAYAADYCETPTLRDANRDQIEAFINHLAERASKDRDGLICQLNSYSKPQEAAQ